ncbi:holin [Chachezhania sediminis]|uniref:holin n=1 Tax=Chachezhania sediminis TaxID=2599291 RepID=UPI00131E6DBB|nr:holin [Chachezhania sediminis]
MDQQADLVSRGGMAIGSVGTLFGWAASVDWIALIGVLVLVASFFVNLVFRRREDRRKTERHRVEMEMLMRQLND